MNVFVLPNTKEDILKNVGNRAVLGYFCFPTMEVNGSPKQPGYKLSSKYLPLCSAEQRNSYRFETTWGWVNNDRIFIFGWTIPLRPLHTEFEIFACVFPFFRILHPFLSKCMQRMRKRRKSNPIRIFFDGRNFRRQCANVIDTTWGRIYFLTCGNFGWKFRTQCAETFTLFFYLKFQNQRCIKNAQINFSMSLLICSWALLQSKVDVHW